MSGTTTPTLACQRLMEADQAFHDLSRGASVRSVVDENGERVDYSSAKRADLLAYIRNLAPLCSTYVPTALIGTPVKPTKFLF